MDKNYSNNKKYSSNDNFTYNKVEISDKYFNIYETTEVKFY